MSAQNGRRGFRAVDRARVLAQAAGKPTGIVLEIGGQQIDLVAVPVGQLLSVLSLLETLASIAGAFGSGSGADLSSTDALVVFKQLGADGARFAAFVHAALKRSAFYGDAEATDDDRALFDEWFAELEPGELVRALPKLTEATMVNANPSKAATSTPSPPAAENSSDGTSNSSTPSFSS